jgi:hypothetical protein
MRGRQLRRGPDRDLAVLRDPELGLLARLAAARMASTCVEPDARNEKSEPAARSFSDATCGEELLRTPPKSSSLAVSMKVEMIAARRPLAQEPAKDNCCRRARLAKGRARQHTLLS